MKSFKRSFLITNFIFLLLSCNTTETEQKLNAKIDSLNAVINSLKEINTRPKAYIPPTDNTITRYCVIYITALFDNRLDENGMSSVKKTAYSQVFEIKDTTDENLYKYMDGFEKRCKTENTFGEVKVIKRGYKLFETYKEASLFIEENTKVETE